MADPIKLKALQNLSNQLPVANQRIAQGQQAARDIQLQQAVKQAPATANIPQTTQQTGAAATQMAGQQMIEQAQKQVQQQGQVGQLALGGQQQQAQANTASLQMGAREQSADNAMRLARISEQAKQELYDKQMQFQKDQQGRALFNEKQLADYAVASAKDENDYRSKVQTMQQVSARDLQIMEHSFELVQKDLEQRIRLAEQQKDQKLQLELTEMKRAAEEAMAAKRAKAANNQAMWQAGGTIVGAAAGGLIGGAPGAMVGASAGGAVGSLAASQTGE